MTSPIANTPNALKLLAHDVRWSILAELGRSDRRVGELVALADRPQNLVSYHLGLLRKAGLVREHRSSADGRDVYYSLDIEQIGALFEKSAGELHPALRRELSPVTTENLKHRSQPRRVLFLCTHNSARSQMAEAWLRQLAGARAAVASAGSEPSVVHPMAARVMAERGIDLAGRQSKSMSGLVEQPWDVVVTVCDRVREVCPPFPANTRGIHWSIPDPAAVAGSEAVQLSAFRAARDEIEQRVRWLFIEMGIED